MVVLNVKQMERTFVIHSTIMHYCPVYSDSCLSNSQMAVDSGDPKLQMI